MPRGDFTGAGRARADDLGSYAALDGALWNQGRQRQDSSGYASEEPFRQQYLMGPAESLAIPPHGTPLAGPTSVLFLEVLEALDRACRLVA